MLKVTDLTINFSGLKAVDGLSFEIEQSEIFGLLMVQAKLQHLT